MEADVMFIIVKAVVLTENELKAVNEFLIHFQFPLNLN